MIALKQGAAGSRVERMANRKRSFPPVVLLYVLCVVEESADSN